MERDGLREVGPTLILERDKDILLFWDTHMQTKQLLLYLCGNPIKGNVTTIFYL